MIETRTGKTRSKNPFYYTILSELNLNPMQTLTDIAKKHNISKQNLNYYSRQLKQKGMLQKLGYGTWQITELGIKYIEQNKVNDRDDDIVVSKEGVFQLRRKKGDLHKYTFQFPIKEGFLDFLEIGGYEPEKGLRGWKPQYKDVKSPFGIKYKNNNNKSITGYLKSRKVMNSQKLREIGLQVIEFTVAYFKRFNLILDKDKAYCQDFHIEVNDEMAERNLSKGDMITIPLNKLRGKITPNDPDVKAKAWADTSPVPSIGSNDIDWWDAYLKMPFTIKKIEEISKMLAKESIDTSRKFSVVADVLKANTEQMGALIEVVKVILPKPPIIQDDTITDLNKIKYIG